MAKRIELRSARRLTAASATFRRPAFAPDGRLALEAVGERGPTVFSVDGKGRLEGLIVEGGAEAAWSPDGARLAFTRDGSDGRREIWVCDAAAPSAGYRLAGGDGAAWEHPAWSPDGQQVACVSDHATVGGLRHLWLLDAAHGDRRRITLDPERSDGHPAFSPDGRMLAFDGDDRADDPREIDVYLLDLGSGELERLSDGTVPTRRPSFVDRRYLLAERRSVAGPTLVVLDRVKRRTLPVGFVPGGEREPSVRVGGGRRGRRVHVAFVRRADAEGARDAVWVAELRGLKADVLHGGSGDVDEDARGVTEPGLPVLPAPPMAHIAGVDDQLDGVDDSDADERDDEERQDEADARAERYADRYGLGDDTGERDDDDGDDGGQDWQTPERDDPRGTPATGASAPGARASGATASTTPGSATAAPATTASATTASGAHAPGTTPPATGKGGTPRGGPEGGR